MKWSDLILANFAFCIKLVTWWSPSLEFSSQKLFGSLRNQNDYFNYVSKYIHITYSFIPCNRIDEKPYFLLRLEVWSSVLIIIVIYFLFYVSCLIQIFLGTKALVTVFSFFFENCVENLEMVKIMFLVCTFSFFPRQSINFQFFYP